MKKKINPVIILPGINHSPTYLYDENGRMIFDIDGKPVGGSFLFPDTQAAKEKISSLIKKLATVAFIQNTDFVYERAYDVGCAAFAYQKCNMSGDNVRNLITKRWMCPVSEMTQEDRDWVYLMVPMQRLAAEIGEENLYFFTFNLVGDPMVSARELDEYIETVKKQRKCEKVTLLSVSLGGTILASYLELFGHKKVDKILNVVSCLDGTPIVADIYAKNFNTSTEFLHHGFLAEVMKEETGHGTAGYLINTLLHVLPEGAFNLALSGLVDSALDTIMINCPQFWAMIPSFRYDELSMRFIGDAAHSALKEKTDRFQQARLNLRDNLLKAHADGVEVNSISGSNLNFGDKMYSVMKVIGSSGMYNSDGIVTLAGATLGATGAADGALLPEGYKQKFYSEKYPDYSYISPDGKIDASTAVLPDNTWIFLDQYHEVGRNDAVLTLAKDLITGKVKDIHTDPVNYPQFNHFCDTYELRRRKIPNAQKILEKAESGEIEVSESRKSEIKKAVDFALEVINSSVGDDEKARTAADSLDRVFKSFGIYETGENGKAVKNLIERLSERASRAALRRLGGGNLIDRLSGAGNYDNN